MPPLLPPEGPEERDYVAIGRQYAEDVVAGRLVAGKWARLACKRHLDDLQRTDWRYHFDDWHANDICDFIEKLPHVEGEWETPTIRLEPVQVFILTTVFGWRRADGFRRFSTTYIEAARKFAKSTLTAAVALYCLTCEGEAGAQIVIGATTGEQAGKVFLPAKRMVEKTPALAEAFELETFARAVACRQNGGFIQPINAKGKTQDGWNPHLGVLDELHAHKDRALFDVIKSAFGARKNPLLWIITTAGFDTNGVCYEQRTVATKMLEGTVPLDHLFAIIFTLDLEAHDDTLVFPEALVELEKVCSCGHVSSTQIAGLWREVCVDVATRHGISFKIEGLVETTRTGSPEGPGSAGRVTNGRSSSVQTVASGNSRSNTNGSLPTETELERPASGGATKTRPTSSNRDGSKITASPRISTGNSWSGLAGSVASARSNRETCAWITATAREQFGDCSAHNAILQSAFSETLSKVYSAHSPTCEARKHKLIDGHLVVHRAADDPFDERMWVKANPMIGITPTWDAMRAAAADAKVSPREEGNFKTKNLNVWMNAASAWLNMVQWQACGDDKLTWDDFKGRDCWIGGDLADKDDITAAVLSAFDDDGRLICKPKFWLPEAVLKQPEHMKGRSAAHYRDWADKGHLKLTSGDWVDHGEVEATIRDWIERYSVRKVTFDQFAAGQLMASRINEDLATPDNPLCQILHKKAANVTDPAKDLEARVKSGPTRFRHDNNPVMNWMASNACVARRRDETILPVKETEMSPNKIDGIDALINAMHPAVIGTQGAPPVDIGAMIA